MARKPTSLPPGIDRFNIVNGHAMANINGGHVHVEGPDGAGVMQSFDVQIDRPVHPGQVATWRSPRHGLPDIDQVRAQIVRCELDVDGDMIHIEHTVGGGHYACYANFGIQTTVDENQELEPIGLLILDDPTPAIEGPRVAVQWSHMQA